MQHLQKSKSLLFICLLISSLHSLFAQTLTQTIRGVVVDKSVQIPIAGATVLLINSNPLKGTLTDSEGGFTIAQVPIGRQTIKVTYIGYKEMVMSNVVVNAGKELVLQESA
ncbi:MAG: carboxypeptidase-like regulatory domain-containing protein [Spirosomataceae bacterium]